MAAWWFSTTAQPGDNVWNGRDNMYVYCYSWNMEWDHYYSLMILCKIIILILIVTALCTIEEVELIADLDVYMLDHMWEVCPPLWWTYQMDSSLRSWTYNWELGVCCGFRAWLYLVFSVDIRIYSPSCYRVGSSPANWNECITTNRTKSCKDFGALLVFLHFYANQISTT